MSDQIEIKNYIIHVFEATSEKIIFSEKPHQENKKIENYLNNHIVKAMNDTSIKHSEFNSESDVLAGCQNLKDDINNFVQVTTDFASSLFKIMKENKNIPKGDVVFCTFEKNEDAYFCMLKLKYNMSYYHDIINGVKVEAIIKEQQIFPSKSQKIDECFFVNFTDLSLKLIEKKYYVNSEKINYFSEIFLKCNSKMSEKEKVDAIVETTEQFSKKHFDENSTKSVEIIKAIAENIEETMTINIGNIAEDIFFEEPELKTEFINSMIDSGIQETEVPISKKTAQRKPFKIQKLKTDDGIEINLPLNIYGNSEKIEFVANENGTVSILIKNVKMT
ncbi:nucleoid-associated protein [Methanimicrococcus sp. OttesenSCG-928-J09]|nr:nucleoid-associated protein [Methanimicrococcus sp. OttesenSCG-928-J09]